MPRRHPGRQRLLMTAAERHLCGTIRHSHTIDTLTVCGCKAVGQYDTGVGSIVEGRCHGSPLRRNKRVIVLKVDIGTVSGWTAPLSDRDVISRIVDTVLEVFFAKQDVLADFQLYGLLTAGGRHECYILSVLRRSDLIDGIAHLADIAVLNRHSGVVGKCFTVRIEELGVHRTPDRYGVVGAVIGKQQYIRTGRLFRQRVHNRPLDFRDFSTICGDCRIFIGGTINTTVCDSDTIVLRLIGSGDVGDGSVILMLGDNITAVLILRCIGVRYVTGIKQRITCHKVDRGAVGGNGCTVNGSAAVIGIDGSHRHGVFHQFGHFVLDVLAARQRTCFGAVEDCLHCSGIGTAIVKVDVAIACREHGCFIVQASCPHHVLCHTLSRIGGHAVVEDNVCRIGRDRNTVGYCSVFIGEGDFCQSRTRPLTADRYIGAGFFLIEVRIGVCPHVNVGRAGVVVCEVDEVPGRVESLGVQGCHLSACRIYTAA